MRKIKLLSLSKIIILLLVLCLSFFLSACFFDYSAIYYTFVMDGDFAYCEGPKDCFICFITIDDVENVDITVPDTFHDKVVNRLGGYYGKNYSAPLCFDIRDSTGVSIWYEDVLDREYPERPEMKEITITIHLGKEINSFYNLNCAPYYVTDDENPTFYHFTYYFDIDLENETFYSKDGIVYQKSDDQEVSILTE